MTPKPFLNGDLFALTISFSRRFQYREGFIFFMDEQQTTFRFIPGTNQREQLQLAFTRTESDRVRLLEHNGVNAPMQKWDIVEVNVPCYIVVPYRTTK